MVYSQLNLLIISIVISFITQLSIQSHPYQYQNPYTNPTKLTLTQNITDQFVELEELIRLTLYDYFEGPLIHFSSQVFNPMNKSDQLGSDIMYVSDAYKVLNSQYINSNEFTSHIEPFVRSSIYIIEGITGSNVVYFVDRDFYFRKYCLSKYSDGQINQVYNYQLNKTFVNSNCQDLVQVPSNSNLLLVLCQRVDEKFQQGKYDITQKEVAVLIYLEASSASFKYLEYSNQKSIQMDLLTGIRPYYKRDIPLFFANIQQHVVPYSAKFIPSLVELDIGQFENIAFGSKKVIISSVFKDHCFYYISQFIPIRKPSDDQRVLDYVVFPKKDQMVAMAIDPYGLLVQYLNTTPEHNILNPPNCNGENTFYTFYNITNIVGLFYNDQLSNFLFAMVSLPAGIYEYNISDPYNIYTFKYYGLQEESEKFAGTNIMTANKNYIIHLLIDIITYQNVLRVYSRNAYHNSIAKYQFVMTPSSKTNFFLFPNLYLDILWFKDERKINVTVIQQQQFVINTTSISEATLQQIINKEYKVVIRANNGEDNETMFNTIILNSGNYSIFKSTENGNQKPLDIFYNCGEHKFTYQLTDIFNGPNFNISSPNDSLFQLNNQQFIPKLSSTMNKSICGINFVQNIQTRNGDGEQTTLLCIEEKGTMISTYQLMNNSEANLINQINIPEAYFVNSVFNPDTGVLLVLSTYSNDWEDTNIEFHFFIVDGNVTWRSSQEIAALNGSNPIGFNYNQNAKQGLLISNINFDLNQQYIFYFSIDITNMKVAKLVNAVFNVSDDYFLTKASISDIGFIFSLFYKNYITVSELTYLNDNNSVNDVKAYNLSQYDSQILDFDLINNDYIILYLGHNDIFVFKITNNIYLEYSMKLPFYAFSQYQFFIGQMTVSLGFIQNKIVRAFSENALTILMYKSGSQMSADARIFVFYISTNQHNTFVMENDFSNSFDTSTVKVIHLIENHDFFDTISIINDGEIKIYDLQYYNYLVTPNSTTIQYKQLIDKCKDYIICWNDEKYRMEDIPVQLEEIQVTPMTRFTDFIPLTDELENNSFTFTVSTQNQGQIITLVQNASLNISFNNNQSSEDNQMLLLQNIFQGFNISYSYNCSYIDYSGQNVSCTDSVTDFTSSKFSSFLIEFVTSSREVFEAFQIQQFSFMFDNSHILNIFYTQDFLQNPTQYDQQTLLQIATLDEDKLFGCLVNGYVEIQDITSSFGNNNQYFMMLFQCKENNQGKQFKMTMIEISQTSDSYSVELEKLNCSIAYNHIKINMNTLVSEEQMNNRYSILDAKMTFIDQNQSSLIITYENEGSYQNEIVFYSLEFNHSAFSFTYKQIQQYDADVINADTFQADEIIIIPGSSIAVVVASDFGAYFFDINSSMLITSLCLIEVDVFIDQNLNFEGEFMVFNVIGDWPYTLHFITNYGLFIFDFNVDLTNRTLWDPVIEDNFIFNASRIIRMNFDHFNYEVVQNQWGYAFLLKDYKSPESYDNYLGIVSFYANENSKLFKMSLILSDQDCHSLNILAALNKDNKMVDEIATSFVCETKLFTKQVSMNPHFMLDFSKFTDVQEKQSKSALDSDGGSMDFNDFLLNITASNGVNNSMSIQIGVRVQNIIPKANQIFYISIIFIIGGMFLGFILFGSRGQDKMNTNGDLISQTDNVKFKTETSSKNKKRIAIDLQRTQIYMFSDQFDQQDLILRDSSYEKRDSMKTENSSPDDSHQQKIL